MAISASASVHDVAVQQMHSELRTCSHNTSANHPRFSAGGVSAAYVFAHLFCFELVFHDRFRHVLDLEEPIGFSRH